MKTFIVMAALFSFLNNKDKVGIALSFNELTVKICLIYKRDCKYKRSANRLINRKNTLARRGVHRR